jgi:DNA-binding transcriptional regulator YiaG
MGEENSLMESLGQKVKYLRKIKGWSQEYLARNIGVSLNTVQRWEMERNEPSPLARGVFGGVKKYGKLGEFN